ncbi:MAG: hypothetical protein GXZ13_04770 [Synergistaceae bacterium]|nr:hypothetical protein [Synergistaceae bacterium]
MSKKIALVTKLIARKTTVLWLALFLLLASVSPILSNDNPLIRVGSVTLSEPEVLRILVNSSGESEIMAMLTIDHADLEKRNAMMNQIIEALLIAEAGKEQGLDSKPEVAFQIKWQTLQIFIREYLKNLSEGWDMSSKTLESYYTSHLDEFVEPEAFRARHIMSPTKEVANSILLKLINKDNFEEIAASYSRDQNTAKNGGDLGWVERGIQDPAIEEAIFNTRVGGIVGPIKSAFGWHVIEVLEHRTSKQLSFKEAEDSVSTKLQMAYVDEEIKKLKQKYIINVDQEALSNLGGMKITEVQD